MHHVTFASYRYPAAIWGHGAPTIWGPVGGIESIPAGLLPWRHPRSLMAELLRNFNNFVHATRYYVLPARARATTLLLASTREMQRTFSKLGFGAQLMPTIGLKTAALHSGRHRAPEGALKLLFVGNIITLKGIDLALHALKQSRTTATLTLVGSGKYLPAAKRLVQELGLQDRVFFPGPMPRQQVLRLYSEYDAFIFPSLHDTGGYAVLEAMFNELPVICLDCGGPPLAVREGCGFRIALGSRTEVIGGLAAAMEAYDQNRSLMLTQGQSARQIVLKDYDWDIKGKQMNDRYVEAVERFREQETRRSDKRPEIGQVTRLLSSLFSFRSFFTGRWG
jgi:glycosyltransferase involved in cell wall biosynthesis